MQLRLQSLKATIGQGLINLFTPIIKSINAFLAKLEVATEAFKRFTETVTGRKSGSSSSAAPAEIAGGDTDLQETEAIAGVQDGYEEAADSAEKYGDAVEEAGKKTKKALAPFDELATLEEETESETVTPVIDIPKAEEIPPELSQDAAGESPFLNGVMDTLGKIKDRLIELGGIFQTGFWEGMGNYKPILEEMKKDLQSIADTVRKAVDKIVALYDEHIHPFFESIRDGLTEILGKLVDGYTEYIVPILDKLAAKFKEVMEGPVGDAIDSAITFIGKLVDALKLLWENVLVPFLGWIADNIFPVLAPILESVGEIFLDLLTGISNVISGIFEALSGLIDFIVGIFTGDWKKAWEGVKGIFDGVWKVIWSIVKTVVESIAKLIEGIMKSVARTAEAIGNLVTGQSRSNGDSYRSYSAASGRTAYPTSAYAAIPYRMPRLATGTVVPPRAGEFAAILGDNKREPEVVSPLSTMRQAFREEIASVGLGQERSGGPIYMQIDGKTFARLMAPYLDSEKSRVGVNLVIGGTGR